MAFLIYDSLGEGLRGGPFPHKAGECCGNVLRRDILVSADDSVTIINQSVWVNLFLPFGDRGVRLKIGKPAESERVSCQEYEEFGYTGLYLAEDHPLEEDAVEIDTDIFSEEVVSGECLPKKPVDIIKIRRRDL